MLKKRLYKPCELTALGIGREVLRQWRKEPGFPKPVRGKYYDIKAVEAYLDKLSNLQPESVNHDDIIFSRLSHGKNTREIPARP